MLLLLLKTAQRHRRKAQHMFLPVSTCPKVSSDGEGFADEDEER